MSERSEPSEPFETADAAETRRVFPGPRARRVEEMIRVDHAGEFGAVRIYRGQRAVFENRPGKERMAELLAELEAGEQTHLDTFDRLVNERRVRPTLFGPLWNAAGFALGAGTALLGEKAAMACTSAVEEVIEEHYRDQAVELGETDPELADTVRKFREDELHHKDVAIAEGAEETPGYGLMKRVIQAGCRIAIKASEKI